MSFIAPEALLLLLLLPAALLAARLLRARRTRFALSHPAADLLARAAAGRPAWRRAVVAGLYALAFVLLVAGLARPRAEVRVPRDEATVALVIDISGSMLAEDVSPSRLTAAKHAASDFVNSLPARFQVAVVAFSDVADVLARPTIDRSSALDAIASLYAEGGTAMGDGLAQALDLLKPRPDDSTTPDDQARPSRPARTSAVLLLSDGYNTAGRVEPLEAASEAAQWDIPVYTIALGTPDGIVHLPDRFGRLRPVPVPPDYDTLREIAAVTGAEYFNAPSEERLQAVYEDLGRRIGYTTRPREVTHVFSGLAALALVLAAAASVAARGRLV